MKNIIIAIVAIIIIPLLILVGLYNFVPSFQSVVNQVLTTIPGPIGESFSGIPTSEESDAQVAKVAAYLLTMTSEQAIDKLKAIKADDRASYDRIIKAMLRLQPNQTEKLLAVIRSQNISDNIMQDTLDQIDKERTEAYKKRAEFLLSLNRLTAVAEFKTILDEDVDAEQTIAAILAHMPDQTVIDFMGHLNDSDVDAIYAQMPETRVLTLRSMAEKANISSQELRQAAQLLASKPIDELAAIVGNENTYTLDQLVDIYQVLGPKRGGRILAKISDDSFTSALTNAIIDDQLIDSGVDKFSKDLLKSLNIYSKYDDNLSELVRIYQDVDERKTADIIRRLYWNSDNVKSFTLDNGEKIDISDEQLALDLLQSFPSKKIATILTYLDNSISTDISTKLALPDLD